AGNKTLTLAIESGDFVLRSECGKNIGNEKIIKIFKTAVAAGFRSFKLYLIIGMPGETDRSLEESVRFLVELRESVKVKTLRLCLSINPFIPKPGTKWENEIFLDSTEFKKRFNFVNKSLKRLGYTAKLENLNEAELQYIIANSNSNIIYPLMKTINRTYSVISKEVKNYAKNHLLRINHNFINT
ncbi:MAG TPA: radical SAM protein, partial [Firmicutes bacterium]|nr:radical SAM protein [Bacillota bacterium]